MSESVKDSQFDTVLAAARERAERTGRSAYIWRFEDGPGAEPRYIVTGPDDTVAIESGQSANIAGVVSGKGHAGGSQCWRGVCVIPERDPDERLATRRYTEKNYSDATFELSSAREDLEDL